MYFYLCFFLCISLSFCLPARPSFPIAELCDSYKDKCMLKWKNCSSRSMECMKYGQKGLDVVWSFCMYSTNDDISACTDRMNIEFLRIKEAINTNTFKCDFDGC